MSEKKIQAQITHELSKHGVVFRANVGKAKTPDGRFFSTGLCKGHSDLVFYRGGKAYFIECKAPGGKATDEQLAFLEKMRAAGCKAGIAHSVEEALGLCGLNPSLV